MSNANLVEPTTQDPSSVADLEKSLTEAVAATTAGNDNNADNKSTVTDTQKMDKAEKPDWIQDKFWTGDVETSAQKQHGSYVSLESAYGRMANDLGQQRELTDKLIGLKRTDDLSKGLPEIDQSELLDNPSRVIDGRIDSKVDDTKEELLNRMNTLEGQLGQQNFANKHPDYVEVGNSTEFSAWVQGSAYRNSAAQKALEGDWAAADELLTEFKALTSASNEDSTDKTDNNAALTEEARKVSLESAANGSKDTTSGKTYSRTALMQLRLTKPEVYDDPAFQTEIMKAYSEGRVK